MPTRSAERTKLMTRLCPGLSAGNPDDSHPLLTAPGHFSRQSGLSLVELMVAVVKAFLAARYTPGIKDGKPVKSLVLLEIKFETAVVPDTFRNNRY